MRNIVLILIVSILICGCSLNPVWFNDKEVKAHVKDAYGEDIEFISEEIVESYDNFTDKYNNVKKIYNCKTNEGIYFTVRSYSYTALGTDFVYYKKALDSTYEEAIINHHKDFIMSELDMPEIADVVIDSKVINIYIGDYKNMYSIADNIANIDKEIKFKIKTKPEMKRNAELILHSSDSKFVIYCNDTDGNNYEVAEIKMSVNDSTRLTEEKVLCLLEESLVNNVHHSNYYNRATVDVDKDLLSKYKPDRMRIVVNGQDAELEMRYDVERDTYITDIFSLSLDRDWNYLKNIVTMLGGGYVIYEDYVEWYLGSSTWHTEEIHDSREILKEINYLIDSLKDIKVFRDGNELTLSEYKEVRNRKYTVDDLEKLLGLDIVLDYSNYTVIVNSN